MPKDCAALDQAVEESSSDGVDDARVPVPVGDVGSILTALARVLRETTSNLGATVDRVSGAVASPGEVDSDLLVTIQNFDRLQQEFAALGDVLSHVAAATNEPGAGGAWTSLQETEALAVIVLSDLKERFQRHLQYGSDGLLLPDSNDIKEF